MSLHTYTPSLSVIDSRSLVVRQVAWYRANDCLPAQARVTRHAFDHAARETSAADARLFLAGRTNFQRGHGLSGGELFIESVDAGWRVTLEGADGQSREAWDSRGTRFVTRFDEQMRPVGLLEGLCEAPLRHIERLAYGGADAFGNGCGRLLRHDDACGSRTCEQYSLHGSVLDECRRFLKDLDVPNWPETLQARDALLEEREGYPTCYRFDATGAVVRQADAAGHCRFTGYDVAGLPRECGLSFAGSQSRTLVSDIHYDARGRCTEEVASNGVISHSRYDDASGLLMQLRVTRNGARRLADLRYAYDPVGNIILVADDAQPTRFNRNQRIDPVSRYCHDSLYRLIEASGREAMPAAHLPGLPPRLTDPNQLRNYMQRFEYDAAGNLMARHHSGAPTWRMAVSTTGNRSLSQRWDGTLPNEVAIQAGFDGNGNQRELQPGQAMAWDARNQLWQVTAVCREDDPSDIEAYRYDGGGQRVRKVRLSHTARRQLLMETRYLPDLELHRNEATGQQWQVLSLEGGLGTVRLLHWSAGLPDGLENDPLRYSFSDHLGSSVMELDGTGAVIGQEGYYPFGGTAWWTSRSALEANHKTIRYSGKERDATGLIYYGYRYYAPWLQRWVSPDPGGVGTGLTMYGFVGDSPVSNVELDGEIYAGVNGRLEKLIRQSGDTIVYRGLDAFPEPDSNLVLAGLRSAANALTDALDMVNFHPQESDAVMRDYFGAEYQAFLSPIKTLWTQAARITDVYQTPEGRDKFVGIESGSGDIAYVETRDSLGLVALNVQDKMLESPDLDLTLGHELTHVRSSAIGSMRPAEDYFYLTDATSASKTADRETYDFERSYAASIFSGGIDADSMSGEPEHVRDFFFSKVRQLAQSNASVPTLEASVHYFNAHPEVQSAISANNADSLIFSAFALQKQRQRMLADAGSHLGR